MSTRLGNVRERQAAGPRTPPPPSPEPCSVRQKQPFQSTIQTLHSTPLSLSYVRQHTGDEASRESKARCTICWHVVFGLASKGKKPGALLERQYGMEGHAWCHMVSHAVTRKLCGLTHAARMHQGIVLSIPNAYTSAAGDVLPPARSSGAICVTVPTTSSVARLSQGCA